MNRNRKLSIRPALAAALLAGTAAAGAAGGAALTKAETSAPLSENFAPQAGAVAGAGAHGSLADMVEAVGPSVVQIQTVSQPRFQRMAGPYGGGGAEDRLEELFEYGNPGDSQEHAPGQVAMGSGFIIDPSGVILTNNHVVEGADTVKVKLIDGRELQGKVLGRDPKLDVAVVKIHGEGPFVPVKWGDSKRVRVGESVFAVGSPFGLGNTVTSGIVSALGREIGAGPYDDFLQVDAAINTGNSGGPLFDAAGRVIGINTAIFSPTGGNVGVGFAIPADMAQKVAKDIVKTGSVSRGRIGVMLQNLTPEIASELGLSEVEGALITDVEAQGPAGDAGLRRGDVVRSFAGKAIDDGGDLARAVAETKAGTKVPLSIIRNGRPVSLALTIGSDAQIAPGATVPRGRDYRPSLPLPRG